MNEFERTIKAYLDGRAERDAVFAEKYHQAVGNGKTVEKCCEYIINEVRKTRRNGFADDEIYGMAVHFYDEEDINAPKGDAGRNVRVVINRVSSAEAAKKPKAVKKTPVKVSSDETVGFLFGDEDFKDTRKDETEE